MDNTRRREIINAITMVPGIVVSYWWMKYMHLPRSLAMIGYTITCICSITFHSMYAWKRETLNRRWLRLDIIGQNIGLMMGITQTMIGWKGILLLAPFASIGLIADLDIASERNIAYIANAANILLSMSFSKRLIIQWFVAFAFFVADKTPMFRGLGIFMWHIMCHVNIHKYFQCMMGNM